MQTEDVKTVQSLDVLARVLSTGRLDEDQQKQVISKILELVKKL